MTDVLYVLANKSKRGSDRELRLSLRSLQKNCKDLGRVFIVTDELPDWIQNVEHISKYDYIYPEISVYDKVMEFVYRSRCSRFLFMNDDFYMMKPFEARNYPLYYRGELVYIDNPSRWQKVNNNTLDYLNKWKKEKHDYGVHCPILYDRLSVRCDGWSSERYIKSDSGILLRSIYGNSMPTGTKIKVDDCKLWHGEPLRESQTGCISTAENAFSVLDEIEKLFPNKSKFEK